MRTSILRGNLADATADLLCVVCPQKTVNGATRAQLQKDDDGLALDRLLQGRLGALIEREEFAGALGTVKLVAADRDLPVRYIVLLGAGDPKKWNTNTWRRLGATLATVADQVKAKTAAGTMIPDAVAGFDATTRVQALIEGIILGQYRFDRFKPEKERKVPSLTELTLYSARGPAALDKACAKGMLLANATCYARNLVNLPSNFCTPQFLADEAKKLAKQCGFACKIYDVAGIEKLRMPLLLTVGRGSLHTPMFIHLRYTPTGRAKKRVALVGKGITFDTGGYDLKPGRSMVTMKNDMGGAAALLAVMQMIGTLKPRIAVDLYIPTCENMIGETTYKSGEVYTARSGKMIEITNTDCEGRLVLADALDVALEGKPDLILDAATLTGGVQYAVGELYTAVFGNRQPMVDQLIAAAPLAGDKCWQLPLDEDYMDNLKSAVAEMQNKGTGGASTITGALFLGQFVGTTPWIHLDIAESAWYDEDRPFTPRGGTGNPARTIMEFLLRL